jgi:lysylphosphatidylglycerol synthetase-like protein (DUF2156 family)
MGVMSNRRKVWVLLFTALAVVALVFLAAGLSDLEFLPGTPHPFLDQLGDVLMAIFGAVPDIQAFGSLFVILIWVAMLLLILLVFYLIIMPRTKTQGSRWLGYIVWLLALYLFLRLRPGVSKDPQGGSLAVPQPSLPTLQPSLTPVPDEVVASATEFASSSPQWVILLVALILALLAMVGLLSAARFFWRRSHVSSPLEQLAQEAQEALVALEAGADVRDTVMRCYFEMSRVLDEQRGIRRAGTMTPREFERELKAVGLPGTHVERLTRLFEGVRYGARIANEQEERQAFACLTAIVEACASSP